MYADDAALFIAPIKEEVQGVIKLLDLFGEATGLRTNFHKSTVVPIRCQGLDINDILDTLLARRATFPIKYLGLRLSPSRLRKANF